MKKKLLALVFFVHTGLLFAQPMPSQLENSTNLGSDASDEPQDMVIVNSKKYCLYQSYVGDFQSKLVVLNGTSVEFELDLESDFESGYTRLYASPDGNLILSGSFYDYENNASGSKLLWFDTAENTVVMERKFSNTYISTLFSKDGIVYGFGAFQSKISFVKIDADGTIITQKSFGGSAFDYFRDVVYDTSGIYIGATSKSSDGDVQKNNGSEDFWVFKIDFNGALIFSKVFGGSDKDRLTKLALIQGNLYVGGSTLSTDRDVLSNQPEDATSEWWVFDNYDKVKLLWLLKMDCADGALVWEKTYQERGHATQNTPSIETIQFHEGTILIGANFKANVANPTFSEQTISSESVVLISIDLEGNVNWNRMLKSFNNIRLSDLHVYGSDIYAVCNLWRFNFVGLNRLYYSLYDVAAEQRVKFENVLYYEPSVAINQRDVLVFKLNSAGEKVWDELYGGHKYDYLNKSILNENKISFLSTSSSSDIDIINPKGGNDVWLADLVLGSNDVLHTTDEEASISIYPNPFAQHLTISLQQKGRYTIFDAMGLQVKSGYLHNMENVLSLESLSSGAYYIRLYAENRVVVRRLVKL